MRNVLGVLLAAMGAALVTWPLVGLDAAAFVAGVALLAGALLLVIDWGG